MMLAEMDIGAALKDPGFLEWVIYAVMALVLWDKIETIRDRRRARSVRLEGTVETSKKQELATEEDVEKLRQELQGFVEEMRAQHNAATTAGHQRVVALSEVVNTELGGLKTAMHDLEIRLVAATQKAAETLHEKVNGVALDVARHEEAIRNGQAHDWKQDQKLEQLSGTAPPRRKPQ